MDRFLPLFPLRLVIFPGSTVPLHIFENRYREMIGEAAENNTEFGIVLALDEGISDVGCTAVVESIGEKFPDGRFNIVARGRRRFTIVSVNQDKEYLRAEVSYFQDEDSDIGDAGVREAAMTAFETLNTGVEISPDHPKLSFQLTEVIDDVDFRSVIQRTRSEAERLRLFAQLTGKYLERREYVAKMQKAAPTNGFGHKAHG